MLRFSVDGLESARKSSKDIAVSVRGLSKSYTIAHDAEIHTTAAGAYAATLSILVFVGGAFASSAGRESLLMSFSTVPEPSSTVVDVQHAVVTLGAPSPASPVRRLAYIDTLRGIACIGVLLCHVNGYWLNSPHVYGLNLTQLMIALSIWGVHGVDLFITLSGFCLFYPLVQRSAVVPRTLDIRQFYRRRAWRLLPAYYTALLLTTALVLVPKLQPYLVAQPITLQNFLPHLFLMQTVAGNAIGTINGSYWSIALEFQLYVVFPALVLFWKRCGLKATLALGIVSALVWGLFALWYSRQPISGMLGGDLLKHFPAMWIEFIAGMTAAALVAHPRRRQTRYAGLLLAVLLPISVAAGPLHIWLPMTHILLAGVFGALIVLMSSLPETLFINRTPLAVVTRIGVVSYSLYLLHQPALLLTAPLVARLRLTPLQCYAALLCVELPLLYLLATLFYRVIEQPSQLRAQKINAAQSFKAGEGRSR